MLGFVKDRKQASGSGRDVGPREVSRDDVCRRYAADILAAMAQKTAHSLIAQTELVEPLSPRELEVLDCLVEGCTNPQIAERLVISVGTVKTHVHHICGKLGVSNRRQAAVRARELDLL